MKKLTTKNENHKFEILEIVCSIALVLWLVLYLIAGVSDWVLRNIPNSEINWDKLTMILFQVLIGIIGGFLFWMFAISLISLIVLLIRFLHNVLARITSLPYPEKKEELIIKFFEGKISKKFGIISFLVSSLIYVVTIIFLLKYPALQAPSCVIFTVIIFLCLGYYAIKCD